MPDQQNDDFKKAAEGFAASQKEYEHVRFPFRRNSMLLDGKYFEVTAYLLVPREVVPDVVEWQAREAGRDKDAFGAEYAMYKSLQAKGCLLHREDGPAYIETEKAMDDESYTGPTQEQYWENGFRKEPPAADLKFLGPKLI